MSLLAKRFLGAGVFCALVVGSAYLWGTQGLWVLGFALAVVGLVEFVQMLHKAFRAPWFWRGLFVLAGVVLLFWVSSSMEFKWVGIGSVLSLFMCLSLWSLGSLRTPPPKETSPQGSVQAETNLIALGLVGIILCGVFPACALALLALPKGLEWFCLLVFLCSAGDICAYTAGRIWGTSVAMHRVSPSKTWQGYLGAVLGIAVVGVLGAWWLELVWWQGAVLVLGAGLCSQTGDLFMSLIKRYAGVKDTGFLVFGHGGVLDRLDSLYMLAPYVYAVHIMCTDL